MPCAPGPRHTDIITEKSIKGRNCSLNGRCTPNSESSSPKDSTFDLKRKMVVCKFFLQGNCRYGNNCWNDHPNGGNQGTDPRRIK